MSSRGAWPRPRRSSMAHESARAGPAPVPRQAASFPWPPATRPKLAMPPTGWAGRSLDRPGSRFGERQACRAGWAAGRPRMLCVDRKSTRLNSSHITISYAVFCLKKKKTKEAYIAPRTEKPPVRPSPEIVADKATALAVGVTGAPVSGHGRRWFFFFNDTATTEIYTLSLHDALPI